MAAIFNLCKKGVKYLRYRLSPRLNVFRMVKTTYMPIFMLLTQFAAMVELVSQLNATSSDKLNCGNLFQFVSERQKIKSK